jgi:hypothetical protein
MRLILSFRNAEIDAELETNRSSLGLSCQMLIAPIHMTWGYSSGDEADKERRKHGEGGGET